MGEKMYVQYAYDSSVPSGVSFVNLYRQVKDY